MKKLTLLFLGVISTFFLYAQTPGTLNLSFGNNGILRTDYSDDDNRSEASLIQPDGKILLAGRTYTYDYSWPTFVRYMPDGSLDPSFGSNGIKVFLPVTTKEYIEDIILQPDGKILALGYRCIDDSCQMMIYRLNPNGSFDNTFYGLGHRTIDFGSAYDSYGYDLALHDDGRILAIGSVMDNNLKVHMALCRLNPDGNLDPGFNVNGMLVMDIGSMHNYINNVAVQDGKILVGGMSYPYTFDPYGYVTLARFSESGTLDPGFGLNGVVSTNIYLDTYILFDRGDMCLDNQGRILYGVYQQGIQSSDFALFRFLPDGPPDNSFGQYGLTVTDMARNAVISALSVQYDGKILTGGYQVKENYGTDFALVRYRDDGSLDPGFGTDMTGIVITDPNSTWATNPFSCITSINIDANGMILASGYCTNFADNDDFATAAYYSGLNVGIDKHEAFSPGVSVSPNPFKDQTFITLRLEERARIKAVIMDQLGQQQYFLTDQWYGPGSHQFQWDAGGLAPGMYILMIKAGEMTYTSKLIKN